MKNGALFTCSADELVTAYDEKRWGQYGATEKARPQGNSGKL